MEAMAAKTVGQGSAPMRSATYMELAVKIAEPSAPITTARSVSCFPPEFRGAVEFCWSIVIIPFQLRTMKPSGSYRCPINKKNPRTKVAEGSAVKRFRAFCLGPGIQAYLFLKLNVH